LIVDQAAFDREKKASADIAISKSLDPRYTAMLHSSFDTSLLFQVTRSTPVPCPDRVALSTDLFKPLKRAPNAMHAEGSQLKLISKRVWIQSYF
jgi:hypothetical protein